MLQFLILDNSKKPNLIKLTGTVYLFPQIVKTRIKFGTGIHPIEQRHRLVDRILENTQGCNGVDAVEESQKCRNTARVQERPAELRTMYLPDWKPALRRIPDYNFGCDRLVRSFTVRHCSRRSDSAKNG